MTKKSKGYSALKAHFEGLKEGLEQEIADIKANPEKNTPLSFTDDWLSMKERRRENVLRILALIRDGKGEYGKCRLCRKGISFNRLRAMPEAKTCRSCAEAAEGNVSDPVPPSR